MNESLYEAQRHIPVTAECDVCVVGGGCTGVFAAVTAARRGVRVCLVECNGFFGGVATAGLVNIWHTLLDERLERQIIGGLTTEVIERLRKRNAIVERRLAPNAHYHFGEDDRPNPARENVNTLLNTEELKIELDELVVEAGVRPFLHARFCGVIAGNGHPEAVVIEDKSGRRGIRASIFIDASGDGDFVARAGLGWTRRETLMPPTACARIRGIGAVKAQNPGFDLQAAAFDPRHPKALPPGFLWCSQAVGGNDELMVAGTRISGCDGADADQLTRAEIEGRRQVRAICDILRENFAGGEQVSLAAVPAYIGLRETRKAQCLHTLTGDELLNGVPFPDAVANGTYPVDVHYSDKPGIVWRRLDGTETYFPDKGPALHSRWRDPLPHNPSFYQIPYRCLVPRNARNVLVAGRIIDTDAAAFGATRVMVNCNQTGEAAGVAAVLALRAGVSVADVDAGNLRRALTKGGAIVL
jgi:hypothetical protein